ncbi:GNAT family N-acetyltransferase [Guptibacillus algicola]|uniref:GNAT family N-acetyltransferase n=1 Tax=Guptibacillus algicola TaxID=225844 RepID=UPI001CD53CF8|nr:GNAT family N-acetyltransferase [Alkalihalobacillus algicola]MCA0988490.1 GNAT family N-acetyltransferase [Alkalihalobacillus algicola]
MKAIRIQSEEQLKQAFEIRKTVFIDEQGTPEDEEYDAFDSLHAEAEHILILDGERAVGTGRWRIHDGYGKLERICILPSHRKQGIGNKIVHKLEDLAAKQGITNVKLHGQVQAETFYHKLGYKTVSDVFMEDGIPHILMKKALSETF